MNKTLYFLILFSTSFSTSIFTRDIRAGDLRVEQLSQETVRVTVNIYTHVHADPVQLELCWGDGNCEQWSTALVQEWPEIDTRHYQLQTFHAYQQDGEFEVTVRSCCWAGDLINLSTSEINDFTLRTLFTFSRNNTQRNTTPQIDPFYAICPLTACSYTPQAIDKEGDSLSWAQCLPDLEGYALLEEIAPSPLNKVNFNSQTGNLGWLSPPFEGFYSHYFCLSEFRDGELISESEYYVLLVIDTSLPIREQPLSTFKIVPNPVRDILYLKGLEGDYFKSATCRVYDALGQLIFSQNGITAIETSAWPQGVYILVLEIDGKIVSKKFLK